MSIMVEIEGKCGQCILTSEMCPNKGYPYQSADDFCNWVKEKKDICDFCLAYKNSNCTNYFFCNLAKEAKEYCEGNIKIINLTKGTVNMLIEMGKIKDDYQVIYKEKDKAFHVIADTDNYYLNGLIDIGKKFKHENPSCEVLLVVVSTWKTEEF